MARQRTPAVTGPDWFLVDWMRSLRVSQADLTRETGIPKGTMSEIYNGKTLYRRELVNEFARALRIEPYELLMHPDEANRLRRLREDIVSLAAENRLPFTPAEPESERLAPRRRAS